MFEKWAEKIKQKIQEASALAEKQYQNSQFDDPVAKKTAWQPLKPGGANFKSNTLVEISPSVYQYQLSFGGLAFIGVFSLIGIVVLLIGSFMFLKGNNAGIFLFLFGAVFAAVSLFMYRSMGMKRVFDGNLDIYWVGNKQPKFSGQQKNSNHIIYFSEIHAIQILSERVRSKNGSYRSYELNLVMKDGSRCNVIDHGGYAQIALDAEVLAQLMSVPVWDVCT